MKLILGPASLSTEIDFTIPTVTDNGGIVKKVGVYSSGGHDSAAMLCLVMAELKATNRLDKVEVIAFTVVKGEGSTYYSERVVEKVSKHFNSPITHINNIPNNEPAFSNGRVGIVPVKDIWEKNHNDTVLYMSINRMAPDDIRPFPQTLKMFYVDEKVLYKTPFLLLHKPQITDIYYKLGCEDIIPWTHSCTVQAVGKCDNCYSCKEREWGFSALGKDFIDTIPPDINDLSFGGSWKNI